MEKVVTVDLDEYFAERGDFQDLVAFLRSKGIKVLESMRNNSLHIVVVKEEPTEEWAKRVAKMLDGEKF